MCHLKLWFTDYNINFKSRLELKNTRDYSEYDFKSHESVHNYQQKHFKFGSQRPEWV